jgi:DNA-binding transcriptional regulator YhcF (GntR family)
MISVRIDRSEPTTRHDQAAADIRRVIAKGEAEPGERLLPAKDIAGTLDVNMSAVPGAMHALRAEGLVEFYRIQGYRRDEVVQMIEYLAVSRGPRNTSVCRQRFVALTPEAQFEE